MWHSWALGEALEVAGLLADARLTDEPRTEVERAVMANAVRACTFLFTDVQGSTRLWQDAPDAMSRAIARHDELLVSCVAAEGGDLVKSGSRGDGALAVFARAADAISCAVALQRAFAGEAWPDGAPLLIRAAVHSGEAETRDDDYFGPSLSRGARLMSIAHGGQAIVSSATAEAAKDSMPDGIRLLDLGDHRLKDLYQPERVSQIVAPGLQEVFPPLASVNLRPHNLPASLTSFVGRDDEMRELGSLLVEARLVTLTGVGGTGKTRLAVQTAAQLADDFRDGVVFVDLAPVRDDSAVAGMFVTAIDVRDPAADAAMDDPGAIARALTDHLVRVLKDRRMLLVVDNCEHVVHESSRLVGALLSSCAELHVLATSREPLAVAGERVYRLPPLTPPSAGDLDLTDLRTIASIRLFCERAAAARSDFQLTAANAPAVADICRRLDGIPLAIELAAARISVLAPGQIADRLADATELLPALGRETDDRRKTLEGTLEWSYGMLADDERLLLARLAVFTGGWTLEAAESVCAEEPLRPQAILSLLSRLVDRSLVVVSEDEHGGRFRMLEPVRQFAERKLAAIDETKAMRNHHRDWFVRQAGDESFMLYTSEARLDELRRELDNFRSAMRWSIDSGESTSALRMATPLNGVFVWLGQRTEGDTWLNEALAIADDSVSDLKASAISALAANLDLYGDVRRGVELQRQAGEMFAALGNRSALLWSQIYLGHGLHFCGEYREEDEVYRQAQEIAVEVGDKIAMSLAPFLRIWLCLAEGDVKAARELCRHVVEMGDGGHAGVRLGVRVFIGVAMFLEGNHEAGSAFCDEPIETLLTELVDAAGNEDPMGLWSLNLLGTHELTEESTRDRGRQHLADLLPRARRTGLLGAFPDPFDSIAALAGLDGQAAESARLFGAVHRLRRTSGIEMRYALTAPMIERGRAAAAANLGETAFESEWEAGTGLSLPESIDLASAILER